MGTDFSIKPVGAPVAAPIVQPVKAAVEQAVPTQLPASQSVTVTDASVNVRNDTPQAASGQLSQQVFLDRDAGAIVYQLVDSRTNLVVRQFPDEALLRRRAYFHTMDVTTAERAVAPVTDRRA